MEWVAQCISRSVEWVAQCISRSVEWDALRVFVIFPFVAVGRWQLARICH